MVWIFPIKQRLFFRGAKKLSTYLVRDEIWSIKKRVGSCSWIYENGVWLWNIYKCQRKVKPSYQVLKIACKYALQSIACT